MESSILFTGRRLQRMRANRHLRDLHATTGFSRAQLIQPLFAVEGITRREEIPGLRGTYRQGADEICAQIESDLEAGVTQFMLFNVPQRKSARGFDLSFSVRMIESIRQRFKSDVQLWVDTCLCSLTESGHCGIYGEAGKMDHAGTLEAIASMAVAYAGAGADGISPSDMMDGRVRAIRERLDRGGFEMTPIMSYSTKFSSQFYGPFRAAADSAPRFGDRTEYQIDVRNRDDAILSSLRCAEEGADLLMVKPGMTSIDLIREIHAKAQRPVGAYQVSGEYAALVLLEERGLVQFDAALLETWQVFRRSGAQYIVTYGARYAKGLGV